MATLSWKRLFYLVTGTVAGVYIALCFLLVIFQTHLIYFPDKHVEATPKQIGLEYEAVTLRTEDGLKLSAWWVPAEKARGALLFCHGNAGNISHRLEALLIFHRLGLSTLLFDYRGYGQSEGKPSEQGTYRDAEAAWRHVVEQRGVPPERIVIFGQSLGGAIATRLASQHPSAALIAESTFTSIVDIGADYYRFFPIRLLSRYQYNNAETIRRVRSPVLVVHSRHDEMIPFSHGRSLFHAAHEPKAFLEITGDHNGGFITSGAVYTEGLRKFLDAHLP